MLWSLSRVLGCKNFQCHHLTDRDRMFLVHFLMELYASKTSSCKLAYEVAQKAITKLIYYFKERGIDSIHEYCMFFLTHELVHCSLMHLWCLLFHYAQFIFVCINPLSYRSVWSRSKFIIPALTANALDRKSLVA